MAVDLTTGNQCRLTTHIPQFIEQVACLFPTDATRLDTGAGQVTGLGIVREGQISHRHHLTHQFHLTLGHTVIQLSAVAEDRINEDNRTVLALFLTVTCHEFGLFFTEHQTGADGIKRETQFLPNG